MDSVVHFEIPAADAARAEKFYKDTFGWGTQAFPMGNMTYIIARTAEVNEQQMPVKPGAINGGIFPRPAEAPNPVIYIDVKSIDETLKKIETAGCKVVTPKSPVANMGFYARFTDTEGNVMGLWENAPAA